MDVVITPQPLSGTVTAPLSKSSAHRAAICAALSAGIHIISPAPNTDDMRATADCITALGGRVQSEGSTLSISGIDRDNLPEQADMYCNESGSTIRFFIPIAAALGVPSLFWGQGNLPNRPLTVLTDALSAHGVTCTAPAKANGEFLQLSGTVRNGDYELHEKILQLSGKLQNGTYALPGNVSSQYITGLLFALPMLEGDSEIRLTTPLESKGYVDLTLQALSDSGIRITPTEHGWHIPGGQRYTPSSTGVEGDYSGAAFWLCAGALGAPVTTQGLRPDSLQGDRAVVEILRRFGAVISEDSGVRVSPAPLTATDIDASQIPDLVPVLAVVAAYAEGESTIYNAGRLRIKESDRLTAITAGLRTLGANIEEHPDKLIIRGKRELGGGTVDSFADHRIAMAMSIAAIGCTGPVTVTGAHCVAKSYAEFYDHYSQLGGNVHVL